MWDLSPPAGEEKIKVDPTVAKMLNQLEKHYQLAKSIQPTVVMPRSGAGPSRAVAMSPKTMVLAVGGDDLVSAQLGIWWLTSKGLLLASEG
jgi:hypothetical protein